MIVRSLKLVSSEDPTGARAPSASYYSTEGVAPLHTAPPVLVYFCLGGWDQHLYPSPRWVISKLQQRGGDSNDSFLHNFSFQTLTSQQQRSNYLPFLSLSLVLQQNVASHNVYVTKRNCY
jgi:hypothetical protein